MNRHETLEAALHAVTDRGVTYGKPEDVFGLIADLWTAYLGKKLDAPLAGFDVSQLMILLKVARAKHNPNHHDNQVDIAGYAACANELTETPRAARNEKAVPSVENLPTVPDFLRNGVSKGDKLIVHNVFTEFEDEVQTVSYEIAIIPIRTRRGFDYTLDGWRFASDKGCKNRQHIIRIERDGATVAEGQVYDE